VQGKQMNIPAGDADAMHNWTFDPSPYWPQIVTGFQAGKPVTIWSASLHMHTRGTHAVTRINRADGTQECMLDIPRWDFHWQGAYAFQTPKTYNPGDSLYLECHWDNSASNQPIVNGQQMPPIDVNWGEGTTDEMCLGGFYITQ
jgi:hypothetical protein